MKKKNKAVSLRYNTNPAPRITSKAQGEAAQRIIEIAENYDIPIVKDEDLVEILSHYDIGSFINEELYEAVANIFALLYELNKDAPL